MNVVFRLPTEADEERFSKGFRIDIYGYDNKFGFKAYCGAHPENNKNME